MLRSFCGGILAVTLLAGAARTSAAQETGTPVFKAPYRTFTTHEIGGSFSDPGEGASFALEGFYRYGHGAFDISFRGGFVDLSGSAGTQVLLGADARTQILTYSESFPLDGALTLGFGASVGDRPDKYFIPIGISLGRRFNLEGSNTTFVPYVHPVLGPTFGGGNSDVDAALGLGVDVRFSEDLALRVSGGVGDIDGVGISLAYIH
ncbi:MAG: hypothetical protein ACJ8DC_07500 [Gemmatimonadales bacterium]